MSSRISSVSGAVGFAMQKSKGQHLLKSPSILSEIIKKSAILPTDTVLEIGPGTGNLTMLLLNAAAKVICVELDPRMVSQLTKRVGNSEFGSKIKIVQSDILKYQLPPFNLCVANIPYQISSPIIFKLLSHRPFFRAAVLMVQKEFAMRLTARPGSDFYCRLSANVQLLAKTENLLRVPRKCFCPPPKVESEVVRIEPYRSLPQLSFKEWDAMLRICFSRKNRTLGAIFKQKSILEILYKNYIKFKELSKNKTENNANNNNDNNNSNNIENNNNINSINSNANNINNEKDNNDICVLFSSGNEFSEATMKREIEDEKEEDEKEKRRKEKKEKKVKNEKNEKNENDNNIIEGKEDENDDDEIEMKGENFGNNFDDSKGELTVSSFKVSLISLLTSSNFVQRRASKMSIEDFLELLKVMNDKGIHFN